MVEHLSADKIYLTPKAFLDIFHEHLRQSKTGIFLHSWEQVVMIAEHTFSCFKRVDLINV